MTNESNPIEALARHEAGRDLRWKRRRIACRLCETYVKHLHPWHDDGTLNERDVHLWEEDGRYAGPTMDDSWNAAVPSYMRRTSE